MPKNNGRTLITYTQIFVNNHSFATRVLKYFCPLFLPTRDEKNIAAAACPAFDLGLQWR